MREITKSLPYYLSQSSLPTGIARPPAMRSTAMTPVPGHYPSAAVRGASCVLDYQPVNIQVTFYGNAVHPPDASNWTMRMQLAFLYPKRPKK